MEKLKIDWKPSDYLNADDLNRIEEWTSLLSEMLNLYGYHAEIASGPEWGKTDILSVSDINRIKTNITKLRDGYFSIPQWRDMILGAYHDFNQQNAMEWDLQTCYNWVERMAQIFVPCGIYFSGFVFYLPQKKQRWKIYSGTIESGGALIK